MDISYCLTFPKRFASFDSKILQIVQQLLVIFVKIVIFTPEFREQEKIKTKDHFPYT